MTNDKLPEEIQEQICNGSAQYLKKLIEDKRNPCCYAVTDYIAGATAWAQWKVKHDELQAKAQRMADALGEVVGVSASSPDKSWAEIAREMKRIANTALQQFKDGRGSKSETSEVFNPESTIICAECKTRPAVTDYNGHGFYVCKLCDDSLSREFDEEYR